MNTTVFAEKKNLKKALSSWTTSKNREQRLTDIINNSEATKAEAKKYFKDELEMPLNEPLLPLHNSVTAYLLDEFVVVEISKGDYRLMPRKIERPSEEEKKIVDTYLQLNMAIRAFDSEFSKYNRFLRDLDSKGRTIMMSIEEAKRKAGAAYKVGRADSEIEKRRRTQILEKEKELTEHSQEKKKYFIDNPNLIACYDAIFTLASDLGIEKHIDLGIPILKANEQDKRPHYDTSIIMAKIEPYEVKFKER